MLLRSTPHNVGFAQLSRLVPDEQSPILMRGVAMPGVDNMADYPMMLYVHLRGPWDPVAARRVVALFKRGNLVMR